MAYGWGWSEKKFLQCTPKYFFQVWKGKRDAEERKERKEWERLRLLGSWVLAPYSKSLSPVKLLPLPWDEKLTKDKFLKDNKDLIPIWDKLDGR